jgi:hypothetical protein
MFEIRNTKVIRYLRFHGLLIPVFILSVLYVDGQKPGRPVIIEANAHPGLILPVYEAINYILKDEVYAYNLSISFPSSGNDFWETLLDYPKSGFGYSFWSLGNDQILGKAHAMYGFLNVPLIKSMGKVSINYQISLGAAYHTKIFDRYENHLNRAIGSHINGYVRLGIDNRIMILPDCELIAEAGISHFSNGKTKSPNYGINAVSVSLGLNYRFNSKGIISQIKEVPPVSKKYVQTVFYSAGFKVYNNILDNKYLVASGSYNLERTMGQRRKAGLGADFFYDGSIREALAGIDGTPEKDFEKLIKVGLHASYSTRYKQTLLGFQVGHYLYYKYTVLTPIYFRVSLQYMVTKNLIASVSVKTHLGIADTLEWGVGYAW